MQTIKVKIKTLSQMINEFGSDHLGTLTTPQFNVFMESWVPQDRIMNVIKLEKHDDIYLIGTLHNNPYYINSQHIEEFIWRLASNFNLLLWHNSNVV